MLPWKNSWFQLAVVAAALSLAALVTDICGFKMPVIGKGGGGSPYQGNQGQDNQNQQTQNNPPPAPGNLPAQDQKAFTNSLGMKFVPAGTSGVLFSIWDTRVEDFLQFVNETGYSIPAGMLVVDSNGKLQNFPNASWQNPAVSQTPDSPVIGINWNDANAFCQWLTAKEQKIGLITKNQVYRLPTDAEWSAAAGSTLYPYGNTFPPAPNAGNYLRSGDSPDWAKLGPTITDTDGYGVTSPVGSFQPNSYGLFDMGGNVFQWVSDLYNNSMNSPDVIAYFKFTDGGGQTYRALRGGSWNNCQEPSLRTQFHAFSAPETREEDLGFRCVLTSPSSWTTYLEIGIGLVVVAGAYFYFKGRKTTDETQSAT